MNRVEYSWKWRAPRDDRNTFMRLMLRHSALLLQLSLAYRLSAIACRLSPISYRLSAMRLMLRHSAVLLQRKRSLIPLAEGLRRSCDEVAE
jgi:hypothetical protein